MLYHKYAIKRNRQGLGGEKMTVRKRLLALKYLEKQKKYPELAEWLGVRVQLKEKENKRKQ